MVRELANYLVIFVAEGFDCGLLVLLEINIAVPTEMVLLPG